MDLSHIISDVVQSAVTKGAKEVEVSIANDNILRIQIECTNFVFPEDPNVMRSPGYEYIFKGEYRIEGNKLEFVSELNLGSIEQCCVSILSANTKLEEFKLIYRFKECEFAFSKNEVLEQLGDVFVGEYNVLLWIEDHIKSGIETMRK